MILSEREMQMAKELARELVRVEREKKRKQFEQAFENVKKVVKESWEDIKRTWEKAIEVIYGIKTRENERVNWHVPIKIGFPELPDIKIPRSANARSNI